MTNADLVLVDTVIWSAFFSKPSSREKRVVDILLDEDRVALTGPILAEVLRGFRRTEQADWVASRMRLAHYFEPTWDDWRNAAAVGRELGTKGQEIPLSDLVIAVLAQRLQAFVYSTDPHFDSIPDPKRFP